MLTSVQVRDSFKYLYPDELPFLKQLVRSLQEDPVVINIGAGAGTSGLAILETRHDVTLITVDITNESSPFGCLEAERDVVNRAGLWHLYGVRWFQYHGKSSKFLSSAKDYAPLKLMPRAFDHWDGASMIFIDGDHSYEGCKDDIKKSLPLLVDGGVLAVHDYDKGMLKENPNGPHPKSWDGVTKAVDEILLPTYDVLGRVDSLIAFRV